MRCVYIACDIEICFEKLYNVVTIACNSFPFFANKLVGQKAKLCVD